MSDRNAEVAAGPNTPSNLYGFLAALRNTLPFLALLWVAPHLADRWFLSPWLLCPVIGLFIYRLTIVMHDCTHSTLYVGRRANRVIGSLLGAATGIDFVSFSKQHWQHHRTYGACDDPQGFHYAELGGMARRDFMWHIARPLFGLNLRHTFAESVIAPGNIGRLARSGELAVVLSVQAAILVLVTGGGRHPMLVALPFLSAATFGLFFSQLRGIAEHGAIDNSTEAGCVRSHAPHWLDRVLLYDLGFNYHAEHHEWPHVPSCRLGAVHKAEHPGASSSSSMLGTLRRIYDSRTCSNA